MYEASDLLRANSWLPVGAGCTCLAEFTSGQEGLCGVEDNSDSQSRISLGDKKCVIISLHCHSIVFNVLIFFKFCLLKLTG